jgi:ankyrin repeat protein
MISDKRLSNRASCRGSLRSQRGRLIELQILVVAAMMFLVVAGVGLVNDKSLFASLLNGAITVIVVIGGIVGLCALVAGWESLREWMYTPAIVRAVAKADPLQALEKLSARSIKVNAVNSAGFTALHVACNAYRPVDGDQTEQVIAYLLTRGAAVDAQTPMGETPLCLAVQRGYDLAVIRTLLAHGARPDAALKHAVWRSREDAAEVVAALLDAGASVAVRDALGETPLHWAAHLGSAKTARMLIDHGADLRSRDLQMQTPLHLALNRLELDAAETTAVVRVLMVAGAEAEAADALGRTPLAMARDSGRRVLVAALNP